MCDGDDCPDPADALAFLMARTALAAAIISGRASSGRFLEQLNLTLLGRGTAVLLERRGEVLAATNSHVLRPWADSRDRGAKLALSVVPEGERAAQLHDGVALSSVAYKIDADGLTVVNKWGSPAPADLYDHKDLAVVRLTGQSATSARAIGKVPVATAEIDNGSLLVGDRVRFRGYPADSLAFDPYLGDSIATGYTLFTEVVEVTENLVVLDAREGRICYGRGAPTNRELRGISGAGVFDRQNMLRAIVWGGDSEAALIYACPIRFIWEIADRLPPPTE
jgi:hypothetical protein